MYMYRRTGFNYVVKSLRFRVLNAYCVFNNCVLCVCVLRNAYCVLIFASVKKKIAFAIIRLLQLKPVLGYVTEI